MVNIKTTKSIILFNVICRSTTKNNINYFKKDVVFPSTVISCIILLIKYYENNLFIYKYMSFLIKKKYILTKKKKGRKTGRSPTELGASLTLNV